MSVVPADASFIRPPDLGSCGRQPQSLGPTVRAGDGVGSSEFSRRSKGGFHAARLESQDSVAAVLAIEAIGGRLEGLDVDALEVCGVISLEWEEDLQIQWDAGTVYIAVKDQQLKAGDLRALIQGFTQLEDAARQPTESRKMIFRVQALGGLDARARSLSGDCDHLRLTGPPRSEADRRRLYDDFTRRWDLPAEVAARTVIDTRNLGRDSSECKAIFAHAMRSVYPVQAFGDQGLTAIYEDLATLFAERRRRRLFVPLTELDMRILRPLVPLPLVSFHTHYVPTEYGYVQDPDRERSLREEDAYRRRAEKIAHQRWRRHTRRSRARAVLAGAIKCPACNHYLIGKFYGILCPDCRYQPFLTVLYACDCGEPVPLIRQPQLDALRAFGDLLEIIRDACPACPSCSNQVRFDNVGTRVFAVAFPYPVEEYSDRLLIELRESLGWTAGGWTDHTITPIQKILRSARGSSM
jgi:hypothetical protein